MPGRKPRCAGALLERWMLSPIACAEEERDVLCRGRSCARSLFQFSHWKGSWPGPFCWVSKVAASAACAGAGVCGGAKKYEAKKGSSRGVGGFSCLEIAVGYSAELGTCPGILLACTSIARGHCALLPLLSLFHPFIHGEANECLSSAQPRDRRKGFMLIFV